MAAEFIVGGRRKLPWHFGHWDVVIEDEDIGSINVYEPIVTREFAEHVKSRLGFEPRSILQIRKAWDVSEAVATALATAIDGAFYCDYDPEHVIFDAGDRGSKVPKLRELERILRQAFQDAADEDD